MAIRPFISIETAAKWEQPIINFKTQNYSSEMSSSQEEIIVESVRIKNYHMGESASKRSPNAKSYLPSQRI